MFVLHRLFLLLLAALLLQACGGEPAEPAAEAVREQLIGTWLREYDEESVRVRRVLVLGPDGRFDEQSLASRDGAVLVRNSHSGEWNFDGTNIKRRYRLIDGRKPSGPSFPYAAFQIRFESRNTFVGIDHVRKLEVRYERAAEGTQP